MFNSQNCLLRMQTIGCTNIHNINFRVIRQYPILLEINHYFENHGKEEAYGGHKYKKADHPEKEFGVYLLVDVDLVAIH